MTKIIFAFRNLKNTPIIVYINLLTNSSELRHFLNHFVLILYFLKNCL
jgi:hypothetical protein